MLADRTSGLNVHPRDGIHTDESPCLWNNRMTVDVVGLRFKPRLDNLEASTSQRITLLQSKHLVKYLKNFLRTVLNTIDLKTFCEEANHIPHQSVWNSPWAQARRSCVEYLQQIFSWTCPQKSERNPVSAKKHGGGFCCNWRESTLQNKLICTTYRSNQGIKCLSNKGKKNNLDI